MSLQRFTRKDVVTIGPERPCGEAAELMHQRHVGAVVVVRDERPVGIVTDRDLALRVLAAGRDGQTPVEEVMSRDLVLAHDRDPLDQAVLTIRKTGVRRLPLVDDEGALVGLVALDDLLVLLAGELASTAEAVMDNRGP